jgi:chitodextrinase
MSKISSLKQIPKSKNKLIIVMLVFALIGSMIILIANASPTTSIFVTSSSSTANLNEEVTFSVNTNTGGESITSVKAVIEYNPSVLEFVAYDKSASAFGINDPSLNLAAPGKLTYNAASFSPVNSTNANIFKAKFRTIGSGSATVSVNKTESSMYSASSELTPPNLLSVSQNSTITINSPPPPPDTTPPATPTGLRVTNGDKLVTVNWNSNTETDLRDYQVRYKVANTSSYIVATNSTALTSQTITNLTNDTDYVIEVRATDTNGNFSNYAAINARPVAPPDTTPPATPTGLKVDSASSNQVKISWSANSDADFLNYQLRYKTTSGSTYTNISNVTATTYTFSGLTNGTAYTFEIAAKDKAGNQSNFATIQSTPVDNILPTISITTPANNATVQGLVNITATANDNERISKVDFFVDGTLNTSDNSSPYGFSLDTSKLNNGQHTILARAFDGNNNQATSSLTVNVQNPVVPPPDTSAPSVPTNFNANLNNGVIVLRWGASNDNVQLSGYRIEKYTNNTLTSTLTVNATSTSLNDGAISQGNTYQYRIAAYDSSGNQSAFTNQLSVNYPVPPDTTPPSAPGNLAYSLTNNNVILSWGASNDSSGIKNYTIYRNGQAIANTTLTTYTNTSILYGTQYTYAIQATDNNNNLSSLSNTVSVNITAPPAPDTGAPTVPQNLVAAAVGTNQINISWNASTDNTGVAGYIIYRNGTEIKRLTGTSFADGTLQPSTTYSYSVSAFDAAGNISAKSSISSATTNSVNQFSSVNVGGKVIDKSNNKAIRRVKVSYFDGPNLRTYNTASSGSYFFTNVPAITSSLNFDKNGYLAINLPIKLGANSTEIINVEMARK